AAGERRREEVDHEDLLADVLARLPGFALVIGGLECGGLVADLQVHLGILLRQAGRGEGEGPHGGQRRNPPSLHGASPCGNVPTPEGPPAASAGRDAWAIESNPGAAGREAFPGREFTPFPPACGTILASKSLGRAGGIRGWVPSAPAGEEGGCDGTL